MQYSDDVMARTSQEFRETLDRIEGPHRVILQLNLAGTEPERPSSRRPTYQDRVDREERLESVAKPIREALERIGFTIKDRYSGVGQGEASILPVGSCAIISGTRNQIIKAIEIPGVTAAMPDIRGMELLEGDTKRTTDRNR